MINYTTNLYIIPTKIDDLKIGYLSVKKMYHGCFKPLEALIETYSSDDIEKSKNSLHPTTYRKFYKAGLVDGVAASSIEVLFDRQKKCLARKKNPEK